MRRNTRSRLLALAGGLLAVQLVALAAYLLVTGVRVTALRYLLYPLAWTTAGVVVVVATVPPSASRRARLLAGAVGVAYFLALAFVDGTIGATTLPDTARVVWLPPGWGPVLLVREAGVGLTLHPFKLVGYGALAYLVSVLLLDATGPLGGVVGLGACVGCAAPGLAGLLSGLAGGSAAVGTVATSLSYDLSTVVFLLALALLYWRPVGVPLHPVGPERREADS